MANTANTIEETLVLRMVWPNFSKINGAQLNGESVTSHDMAMLTKIPFKAIRLQMSLNRIFCALFRIFSIDLSLLDSACSRKFCC